MSVAVAGAAAQAGTGGTPSARTTAADSVFARARQLVLNGNGAAGRVLVDSVVAATTPDTPAYAEALYWRATLAAEGADAERDYRRIIVDYPLSRRANEALLQLGELEAARGDRAAASAHLERFLLENPHSSDRARVGLQVVRLSFDANDVQRGCLTLGRVLNDVPPDAVETRNQLTYFSPRCTGVDTTRAAVLPGGAASQPPAPVPTPAAPPSSKPSSSKPTSAKAPVHDSAAPQATARAGRYSLQLAAFPLRADAERLAKKLAARGYETRVDGTSKPFRVRLGRYATRADAAAEARRLKAKKIDAYVIEIGAENR